TPGSASASGVSPARPTSTAKPTYEQLARRLSGTLAQPGQTGFRPRALLYTPQFHTQPEPEAIAHVATAADVAACVRFARDGGAPPRVSNGGGSPGGRAVG